MGIEKYNETDYVVAEDNNKPGQVTHLRIENRSLYILESSPGLKFAEFRGNKIYIKVWSWPYFPLFPFYLILPIKENNLIIVLC